MIENRDLVADVPNLNCIPLIYYPLSVMCVDDEDLMLKGLKHNLGKTYQIITVDNPFTAIEKLKDLQTNLITINYLKKTINHQESDYTDIQLNIKLEQLYNLFNDENKENEVGVVISDYMMHDMNGLEFCKKITQLPCKKMLLTQRQDTQKIYLAFQNNIIHLFYEKTQTDLIFNLLTHVTQIS
jgi:CheY-like chemotaxis protein